MYMHNVSYMYIIYIFIIIIICYNIIFYYIIEYYGMLYIYIMMRKTFYVIYEIPRIGL